MVRRGGGAQTLFRRRGRGLGFDMVRGWARVFHGGSGHHGRRRGPRGSRGTSGRQRRCWQARGGRGGKGRQRRQASGHPQRWTGGSQRLSSLRWKWRDAIAAARGQPPGWSFHEESGWSAHFFFDAHQVALDRGGHHARWEQGLHGRRWHGRQSRKRRVDASRQWQWRSRPATRRRGRHQSKGLGVFHFHLDQGQRHGVGWRRWRLLSRVWQREGGRHLRKQLVKLVLGHHQLGRRRQISRRRRRHPSAKQLMCRRWHGWRHAW